MQILPKKLLLLLSNDMHLNQVKNKYFFFFIFIKNEGYITM